MPEFFLPYTATTNPENVDRIMRSIREQRELDSHLGLTVPHRRTLFTDRANRLPHEAAEFFNGGIFESNPFVQTSSGVRFSLSMLRNEAIRYGRAIGAEWTMLCDSDTIIVPKEFPRPSSAIAIPNLYLQDHAGEKAISSLAKLDNSEKNLFTDGNSWFILHRDVLNIFLFNEAFTGYSWEDNEFLWRILGAGFGEWRDNAMRPALVDLTIIHSHHPASVRRIDEKIVAYNRGMATCIRWMIEWGLINARDTPPLVEIITAIHPNFQSDFALCPERKIVIRLNQRAVARYEQTGEVCRVYWPYFPMDIFRRYDGKLIEVSLFEEMQRTDPREGTGW